MRAGGGGEESGGGVEAGDFEGHGCDWGKERAEWEERRG